MLLVQEFPLALRDRDRCPQVMSRSFLVIEDSQSFFVVLHLLPSVLAIDWQRVKIVIDGSLSQSFLSKVSLLAFTIFVKIRRILVFQQPDSVLSKIEMGLTQSKQGIF